MTENSFAEKIQVTPEYLLERKEAWKKVLSNAQNAMNTMEELLNTIESSFDAQAVRLFISSYQKQQEKLTDLFGQMEKHIEKLGEIAEIYSQTERSNDIGFGKN